MPYVTAGKENGADIEMFGLILGREDCQPIQRQFKRKDNNEDIDGINLARSTRQYRSSDWVLAGRVCRAVLRF
jgi:hypothetical protein